MKNNSILTTQTFSDRHEREFECSVILQDYMADCVKVLKCDVVPVVTEKYINATELTVNTRLCGKIIYLSDYNSKLKGIDFSEDISHTFKLKPEFGDQELKAECDVKLSGVGTKMSSARKIDIKGKMQISLAAGKTQEHELYSENDENTDVCVKVCNENICTKSIVEAFSDTVSADLELDSSKKSISEIIYSHADGYIQQIKCLDGNIEYSGIVQLHILYEENNDEAQEGTYQTVTQSLSFEGVIPLSEATQDSIANLCVRVFMPQSTISYDSYGENRIISSSVQYVIYGSIYNCQNVEFCTDAFDTQYACDVKMCSYPIQKIQAVIDEKALISENVKSDLSRLSDIADSYCSITVMGTENTDDRCFVNAKADLTLLGYDKEGAFDSLEVHFNTKIPVTGVKAVSESVNDINVSTENMSLSRQNGSITCNINAKVTGVQLSKGRIDAVEELNVDKSQSKSTGKAQLCVYYPDADETLWSVAKSYGASPVEISKINKLEGESLESVKFVMIPRRT